ncbi:hypothetical protein ACFY36_16015 [Actinoplanes sp. NPDC000266]
MSEDTIRVGSLSAERQLTLTASPDNITAGGVVQLIATSARLTGEYDVTWRVEGPVTLPEGGLGITSITGRHHDFGDGEDEEGDGPVIRATLDTSALAVGQWTVRIDLERTGFVEDGEVSRRHPVWASDRFRVSPRPFTAGDDVSVSMRRAAVTPTTDQALWVSIRNSTANISFNPYIDFIDRVWRESDPARSALNGHRSQLRRVERRTALPFPHVERYRLLKAATEVFLMINVRTDPGDFRHVDLEQESARLNRDVRPGELEEQFRRYLVGTPTGDGGDLDVLPYLDLVRRALGDVPVVGLDGHHDEASLAYGILAEKLTRPVLIEPIHEYWLECGGLMRTINAITWRFQNRANPHPGRDPLAGVDIDPLRPLNNVLWGWLRDADHRLTEAQRRDEYKHHYGLPPGPSDRRLADTRTRFMGAFHSLLAECLRFYEDDDLTVKIANGFDVLNSLKETHLLLTQGAHNQYGDLPWTARHEFLMAQWILSRAEIRDFLPHQIMVDTPETWMRSVDSMNRLQRWSDVSAQHYRDLAEFAEQLLLGIRFGAWTSVNDPDQAANWARYFRREVQQYCHAYQAVTGQGVHRRAHSPAALGREASNGYARRPQQSVFPG